MKQRITSHGWAAIVVCLGTFGAALTGTFWLVNRLAYVVLLTLILSYLWARLNVAWLRIERRGRATRAQLGQEIEEQLVLSNDSRLPKLWLELDDRSTLPDHLASAVVGLPARQEKTWTVRTTCLQRGQFRLGPLELATGDPLGLFKCSIHVPTTHAVIVYPKIVDLSGFSLSSSQSAGDGRNRYNARYQSPITAGVREYVVGDSFGRIHWPTTAHAGRLMVKEFEHYPATDVWLLVDMEERVQAGSETESTEEYAATLAASLAVKLLDLGYAVGFAAFGNASEVLPPDRGTRHLMHILEALATLKAYGTTPLETVIGLHSNRFTKQTTLIAISAAPLSEWTPTLGMLTQRGVRSMAIAMQADSFDDALAGEQDEGSGVQVPLYMVHRGDDLATVLSTQG